jgi:hypothetical protein
VMVKRINLYHRITNAIDEVLHKPIVITGSSSTSTFVYYNNY